MRGFATLGQGGAAVPANGYRINPYTLDPEWSGSIDINVGYGSPRAPYYPYYEPPKSDIPWGMLLVGLLVILVLK